MDSNLLECWCEMPNIKGNKICFNWAWLLFMINWLHCTYFGQEINYQISLSICNRYTHTCLLLVVNECSHALICILMYLIRFQHAWRHSDIDFMGTKIALSRTHLVTYLSINTLHCQYWWLALASESPWELRAALTKPGSICLADTSFHNQYQLVEEHFYIFCTVHWMKMNAKSNMCTWGVNDKETIHSQEIEKKITQPTP